MDAGSPGVFESDNGSAGVDRQIEDLANLVGDHFAETSAKYREILSEDEDGATIDSAVTRHHSVAERFLVLDAKSGRLMPDELIDLLEGVLVEESLDPLTGGEFARLVLPGHRTLGPGVKRLIAQFS